MSNRLHFTYAFSAAANDGRVEQRVDAVSGETVSHQYDELGRLTSADAGTHYQRTYPYDGFGNMTSVNGSSLGVDPATNRVTG